MHDDDWLILVTQLPGRQGKERMRSWRALKASGAGILRDGVYVLPASDAAHGVFAAQRQLIEGAGGSAFLLSVPAADAEPEGQFSALFDRTEPFRCWMGEVADFIGQLASHSEAEARRSEGRLRRSFDALAAIDFFPGAAQAEASDTLAGLTARLNAHFSPDEPQAENSPIDTLSADDFRGRLWATRQGIWVDRVASAWLIRRFIDPDARFLWLASPDACSEEALGFDFDGATFTHVSDYVTFEVLLRSFDLHRDPALLSLGAVVHYLDVGGSTVDDAAGLLTMLAGVKQTSADDDAMLAASSDLLNHLYAAYTQSAKDD